MTFVPPGGLTTTNHVFDDWARQVLLDQRVVFLRGELDDITGGNLSAQLMLLDGAGDDEVHMRIDSAGGSLQAAAALIDVIDNLGVPVEVLATRAEGPALAVLAVCEHRAASPHATLRMIEPDVRFEGNAANLVAHLDHYRAATHSLWRRISDATRMTPEHVAEEFASRRYLSPEDAQALGIIDEIVTPPAPIEKLRRPFGFRPPDH